MEITANAVQTVAANQNVLFTGTVVPGNCSIIHRSGSGITKLRGISQSQCRARFKVFFNGNIAVPTGGTLGAISLAIAVDGEAIPATTMTVTPAAVAEFFNVSGSTYIDVPRCCCSTVSIVNPTTATIDVENANLIVERVA